MTDETKDDDMDALTEQLGLVKLTDDVSIHKEPDDYDTTISIIKSAAERIEVCAKNDGCTDGRIMSAMKEAPFLEKLKEMLLDEKPHWEIAISPPRASCDIMINTLRINLKLSDCKTADNSVNKSAIYYSITGLTTYPNNSNWNKFYKMLLDAKSKNQIKLKRDKMTEYHYLVKNKLTGDVIMKSIFDIHTYVSNPSNDLQISWRNEFKNIDYAVEDENYTKKVEELLKCIQKSVKEMIRRSQEFAEGDVEQLFIQE